MPESIKMRVEAFRAELRREYVERFPRSAAAVARPRSVLDGTSHAIRENDPFMPRVRRCTGAHVIDLDDHCIVDYWQGHFANLLGHNPPAILEALEATLRDGRGLQSGMLHEIEEDVGARLCSATETDAVRFTSSGTLASFYAVLLARAFTGRDRLVKAAGGWHGGQPFALKGVSARDGSFEHLESEGLSAGTTDEIVLTQFNDPDDLHAVFQRHGGRIAAMLVEPVLGAGGGMAAALEYLREARRLTELHGALLICDEIITAFRFTPRDLSASYGVRPDLLVLGKVLGGGMPVAAVAGRRDVLELCSRTSGRVKFEGGTYSAHELSLVAARAMLTEIDTHAAQIYPQLADRAENLRRGLTEVGRRSNVPMAILGAPLPPLPVGSLVMPHLLCDDGPAPRSPQELSERQHPAVDERLLRSVLLLHDLSTRTGIGAVSLAHDDEDIARTLVTYEAGLDRLRAAGLLA